MLVYEKHIPKPIRKELPKTMDTFLMKPKIDFAFKEIMMDEAARTGFLSAMLHLEPEEIRETHILNSHLRKLHENDKLGILDVRVSLNDDTEIDTEIQLSELKVWADRSLFYVSKMFTEQIGKGQDYGVLKKCVGISILDFILFEKETEFYSCFHITEDTRHFLYTDKMEFHVLELPKLPKHLGAGSSDIALWAKFINSERKEEFDLLATQNPYIEKAYEKLQVIRQDKEKRMEYEAREKAVRDYNQAMREAEQRGEARGEARGKTLGEALGRELEAIAIARNLLSIGTDIDIIVTATNLPRSHVESLLKELGCLKGSKGIDLSET